MKLVNIINQLKKWRKVTGMVFVLVLLPVCIAKLLTSDDIFVVAPSLFFIILLTILARRLLP